MENHKNMKKRQRSENWLEEDKNLLIDLVRERVSFIENKNTDTNTNSKKLAAWTDLLNSFNSMCKGGKRTLPQVKGQWCLLKMTKKKRNYDERKDSGGGGHTLTIPDETQDIVVSSGSSLSKNPSSSNKPIKKENMNKASAAAESIAIMENACRKELHEVQMANEERRARNLDLEESLLKAKIEFLRKRIQLLENDK